MKKLLQKYNSLNLSVKASLWFMISGFFQKGISMLTTPIFTRILSPEQYGLFSVYQAWHSIMVIFVGLNISAEAYVRGLVKNEDDKERFTSSLLGLSLTLFGVWIVIYGLFHSFFNKLFGLSSILILFMIITVPLSSIYSFWAFRKREQLDYKPLVALTMGSVVSSPVMGIIFVLLAPEAMKVEGRVLAIVVTDAIFYLGLGINIMRKGKTFYNGTYWKYAIKFCIPLIPHYLSYIVLNQSDRIMIEKFCGLEFAGMYSVAYSLAYVMHVVDSSISSTLKPWMYKCIKDGRPKDIAKVSYYILLVMAAVNLALMVAAPELILILAPPSYSAAVWVIPPVTASVFFTFMYNLFSTFEYYYEKTAFVAAGSLGAAVLNIVLNAVFLYLFRNAENGFIAAGYTTLACYIVYAIGHYVFMRYINKTCMNGIKVYNAKIIILISVVFLILSAFITMLYPFKLIRWGIVVVGAVVAIILRKKIISLFKMIKKRN